MPVARLLAWYDAQRRDLPWRRTRDPYRIWVSEVMLQQTRVDAVVAPYRRFLDRFPDLPSLAAADLPEVLAAWSGLGYYRRARQLHAAARRVAAAGGELPRTEEGLRELPGIGPYTAAAVASIAFGVAVPVLDGNVERVLARTGALEDDPRSAPGRRRLRAAAEELLSPHRPGDSNQAVMELGATVCTPRRPDCAACPLRQPEPGWDGCAAAARGEPERYPPPRRRRAAEHQRRLVALVERAGGEVLLFRRPDDSALLAGTWELPWCAADAGAAGAAAALERRYGGRWKLGERLGDARHGITYRALELAVHRAEREATDRAAPAAGGEPGWFPRARLGELPLSSMVGKALAVADGAAVTPRRGRRRR